MKFQNDRLKQATPDYWGRFFLPLCPNYVSVSLWGEPTAPLQQELKGRGKRLILRRLIFSGRFKLHHNLENKKPRIVTDRVTFLGFFPSGNLGEGMHPWLPYKLNAHRV